MSDENTIVSIVVLTYGHEKYIEQALESILMQKVNFKYEIIVGEDCSPDGTRKILKAYERKHADKFTMIYRDKNIGAHNNELDINKQCRGKYIAYLEGDDYWISDQKLQSQVDYLESHQDCIATAHRVRIVDELGNEIKNEKYPECNDKVYTFKHYKQGLLPGQSASIVSRNIYKDAVCDTSIFTDGNLEPGDRATIFVLATHGDIYCFPDIMSAYRHITTSGSSYSAMKPKKIEPLKKINYYHTLMKYAQKNAKNQQAIETAESLYFWVVVRSLGNKDVNFKFVRKAAMELEYKGSAILFIFYQIISWPVRHFVFKQEGRI